MPGRMWAGYADGRGFIRFLATNQITLGITTRMPRRYYSIRTGKHPHGSNVPLPVLASLLYTAYGQLAEAGYFQEHFGYSCDDLPVRAGQLRR